MDDETACPLHAKRCAPCTGATPKLTAEEAAESLAHVPSWSACDGTRIEREFRFRDFASALAFVNQVGAIAEDEGHHPDILLHRWKRVKLTLTTHAIGGLSENDFIVAAKIDRLEDPEARP